MEIYGNQRKSVETEIDLTSFYYVMAFAPHVPTGSLFYFFAEKCENIVKTDENL